MGAHGRGPRRRRRDAGRGGPRPGDIADILHTSGTTGPAKGFTNPRGNLTVGRSPEGTGADAIVVLRDPRALDGLPGFLAGRLKPHEHPERFHDWPSLPRGATGKVVKAVIRQQLGPSAAAGDVCP
ncbi:hypothetical protein ACIOC2_22950 [Streptomyces sp. NPDC088337]|uniref:hypothetical protein n=1 Tax=unclassified Streptomyces TaxID=2593676 RepID=UPI002DDC04D8|nr:hypothetical protein [Streptomyces sp. NBC_01788]WSB30223.1 hypothetical protein OIE49_32560 [Streptomyces sp. NBC_01788]